MNRALPWLRWIIAGAWLPCTICSIAFADPIPETLRVQLALAPFYQQYVDADGLPIIGSAKVQDAALHECAWIVRNMLSGRRDLLRALIDAKVRFVIMAHDEYTTDVPEQSAMTPRAYWDRRARGLGATPRVPIVSGGEENLLTYPGDPYPTEIIPLHEFAHAIHLVALAQSDASFDGRLRVSYERAISAGLWQGTYAAVNAEEYWAECVQSWFDNNAENNALHNSINTREELLSYDVGAAELCGEVFQGNDWRYLAAELRPPSERLHLAALAGTSPPQFRWREEPVPDRPQVSIDTAIGEIKLEFVARNQPSVETDSFSSIVEFLEQVHRGRYSSGTLSVSEGRFTLTPSNPFASKDALETGQGIYRFVYDEAANRKPNEIIARVILGTTVLDTIKNRSPYRTQPVQRAVRLNH